MRRLGLLLVAALACTPPASTPDAAPVASSSAAPIVEAGSGLSFTFADASPVAVVDAGSTPLQGYLDAAPKSGKSIGHTSVVFKLELAGDLVAACKPESKRGHRRYRGEIAAYRLAQALHLRNVPPALYRAFDPKELRDALAKDAAAAKLFDDEAVVAADGRLHGAIIPWIPKLEFLPLEGASWRARFTGWLSHDGSIPEEQRSLAGQISTMIAFDVITGNWDRWSGGNVGLLRATNTLLFIDNDGTFFDPVPPQPLAAQLALLKRVDHFSKSFIANLRALDALALADATGFEVSPDALLAPKVLAAADERRRKVVEIVDAKIATWGEASVLSFE